MKPEPFKLMVTAYDYRPMRGGIATCAFELTRALSRMPGVEVMLLAPKLPEIDGSAGAEFDSHGFFQTKRLPMSRRSELAAFQLMNHTWVEAEAFKPDAVLQFLWLPEAAGVWLARRLWRKKIPANFVVVHGVEILESDNGLRKKLRGWLAPLKRRILNDARTVFTVSRYTSELVCSEAHVSPNKTRVIYNAVDAEKFQPGARPQALIDRYGLKGKFVFFTLTRLVDYKGMDIAIRALAELRDHPRDFIYLIAGEGGDRPRLEALVRALGMEAHVRFIGAIAENELCDHYRVCDCFVMLSREDRITPNVEGFGIVYLEAAACEKPCIGGRAGGVPDAVEDGNTGWLVDPMDEAAIAETFTFVLNHPEEAARRGRAGRVRVREKFQWPQIATQVMKEIRRHVRN